MFEGIDASVSALGAFSTKLNVTAHNLANMQSENYTSYDTVMEEIPSGGVHARVRRQGLSDQFGQNDQNHQNQQQPSGLARNNSVDVVHELASLIETKFAYTANMKAVSMQDALMQVGIHLGDTVDKTV